MDKNLIPIGRPLSLLLTEANLDDLIAIKKWFVNDNEVEQWAGPSFKFGTDERVDFSHLCSSPYASYCIHLDKDLLAFGQYQREQSLLHLARLIVAPKFRGQGIISTLISGLIDKGNTDKGVQKVTLYVNKLNPRAYHSYLREGFVKTELPKGSQLAKSCYFMHKDIA